jgi:hypothetical protein
VPANRHSSTIPARLDQAVGPEADQRDRTRDDPGADRDSSLDAVPAEPDPSQ